MEAQQQITGLQARADSRRFFSKALIIPCSLLIGLCFGHIANAATDAFPAASQGFSPKSIYTADTKTVVEAFTKTFQALSIRVVSAGNMKITTDYIEGPAGPTGLTATQVSPTRYKYDILISPPIFGKTLVTISTTVEASGIPGQPAGWHNVTLFNHAGAVSAKNWLYEAFEGTLNGNPPTLLAGAKGPAATPAVAQPQPGAAANSGFDGGLGDSGDVGGGANAPPAQAPKPQTARAH